MPVSKVTTGTYKAPFAQCLVESRLRLYYYCCPLCIHSPPGSVSAKLDYVCPPLTAFRCLHRTGIKSQSQQNGLWDPFRCHPPGASLTCQSTGSLFFCAVFLSPLCVSTLVGPALPPGSPQLTRLISFRALFSRSSSGRSPQTALVCVTLPPPDPAPTPLLRFSSLAFITTPQIVS